MTGLASSVLIPLDFACRALCYFCQHRDWLPAEWNGEDAEYVHRKVKGGQVEHCDASELILAWAEQGER